MSDEGITYAPTGIIEVTFDDKTYKLGRAKIGHLLKYSERLEESRNKLVDAIDALREEVDEAEKRFGDDSTSEARAEIRRMERESRYLNNTAFREATISVLAEMFDELGDPLPSNTDEWPAWMADTTLPATIITHWRNNPKASGSNGETQ